MKFKEWKVGEEEKLDSPSVYLHSCCGCHLRHIFTFEIKKDKLGQYISMRCYPDWQGTQMRREIESKKSQKKKKEKVKKLK